MFGLWPVLGLAWWVVFGLFFVVSFEVQEVLVWGLGALVGCAFSWVVFEALRK